MIDWGEKKAELRKVVKVAEDEKMARKMAEKEEGIEETKTEIKTERKMEERKRESVARVVKEDQEIEEHLPL